MNRAILFPSALIALAALSLTPEALAGKPQKVPFEAGGLAMYDMPSATRLDAVLFGDDGAFVGTLSEFINHRFFRSAPFIEGSVELIFDDDGMNTLQLEIYEKPVFEADLFVPVGWTVSEGTGVFAGVEGSGELFWNVVDSELAEAEFELIGELVFR